jgi:hypothetical protein
MLNSACDDDVLRSGSSAHLKPCDCMMTVLTTTGCLLTPGDCVLTPVDCVMTPGDCMMIPCDCAHYN